MFTAINVSDPLTSQIELPGEFNTHQVRLPRPKHCADAVLWSKGRRRDHKEGVVPEQAAPSGRPQPGGARARLGAELKRIRTAGGKSQRDLHGPKGSGHASNVENGYTQPSWEFIEKYLELGGDRRHLRSLYELSRTESDEHKAEQRRGSQPGPTRPPVAPQEIGKLGYQELRRHYTVETREECYAFDDKGVVTTVRCRCAIRANSLQTVLLCGVHSYDADLRPGVLQVEADQGCTLERVDTHATGSVHVYFRSDRPLNPGDTEAHRSSYVVLVDSAVRARPILLGHPRPGTRLFRLTAQFSPLRLPRQIWWFAAENELSATIPEDGYMFPDRPDGRYRKSFEVLVPGWCYGFAWQW